MKPLKRIIEIAVSGVVVFALNACDKKNTDDANVTAPTQITQQGTHDGTSASNTGANAQTATPAQSSGVATGDTHNGVSSGNGQGNATTNRGNSPTESSDDNGTTGGNSDNNGTAGGESNDRNTTEGNGTNGGDGNSGTTTNGGDDNNTTTGGSEQNTPTLKALTLSMDTPALNKDTNTTLNVQAAYNDNSTKELTNQVQWHITSSNAVKISGHTLTAIKDVNVTLQAEYQGKRSNPVTLSIYWEVNGHRLPPEPDPVKNNATLLGIDSNNNGVRDDVERWIYETYKDKHPIYIDIAMQAGRAYKHILETPEKAKEIHDTVVNAPLFCASYYMYYAKLFNDPILVHERIDAPVKSRYFNTKERSDIYWEYDKLLSGDSYPLPGIEKEKSFCDFDTSKYKE